MKSTLRFGSRSQSGFILFILLLISIVIGSCSTFKYKTYEENEKVEDPEPNYNLTLTDDFQQYTSYMFIGNRIENFGTYFNTFYNASENFEEAYQEYIARVLSVYSERLDSIYSTPPLSSDAIDKFNKCIEKASRVIQYHKSSAFMDQSVLLIGKAYYYLGDNVKAERKFSEFLSKLSSSRYIDEAVLYYAKTQMRVGDYDNSLERLNNLIKNSDNKSIVAESYQTVAEYYIRNRDYESAIKNYRKSIELSNDNDFKAQMQFIIATVTSRNDHSKGAAEFGKVLEYSTSYELEYLARYNFAKNLILSNQFTGVAKQLDQMEVEYKDNIDYLSEIELLYAKYYVQRKNYKKATERYLDVILMYPKTPASSDASYALADYYENQIGDYLNALRYYRYSTEENSAGHYAAITNSKFKTFKRYFELMSVIAGKEINTDYDTSFLNLTRPPGYEEIEPGFEDEGEQKKGRPGGSVLSSFNQFADSLQDSEFVHVDSTAQMTEKIAKAKFELAELFVYDLNKPDSAEKYLWSAYEQSEDSDFKSTALFTLSGLFRSTGDAAKADEVLKTIIEQYPLSKMANESRRLLNLPLVEESSLGPADSIYSGAENYFVKELYSESLNNFVEIVNNYPDTKYFERANYACGWIYENILHKYDSAYYYYSKLVEKSPNSELSLMIAGKLQEYRSANEIPGDSLKSTDTSKTEGERINKQEEDPVKIDETGDVPDPLKQGDPIKKEEDPVKEHGIDNK